VCIFLTGAGGYVGLHILRELLETEHPVTAAVRSLKQLGPLTRHPRLTIVEGDIEDEARIAHALRGHSVFVHAALIWGPPGSELQMRDTAAAAKLFEAAGSAGLTRSIYISSLAVHRPFSGEMSENDCLSSTDFYGATKAAGELFLRAACAEHQMTGVVVRPGPVVGPPAFVGGSFRGYDRIAKMVGAAAEDRPIEVMRGDGRQFCDASVLARAVRLLTRAEHPHPTYICVDRDIITWERVARLAKDYLNSASEIRVLPRDIRTPMHSFRTDRLEELTGAPLGAEGALLEHIRHIADTLGTAARPEG
jgi:nucleoside-diphosphate-sugar epimerase